MGVIQRLYDFMSGTRISSQQVDDEFNQLVGESNSKETRVTNLENNKVPYTGATKDVNLGIRRMTATGIALTDGNNDEVIYQFNEDNLSGDLALKTRNALDNSFIKNLLYMTKDGVLSVPNQSFVSVTSSGTQSFSSGVNTKVTILTNESIDNQSEFDTTNVKFTVKEDGEYDIRAFLDWSGAVPTGGIFAIAYKNGVNVKNVAQGFAQQYVYGGRILKLIKGDIIELYINQNSSGTAKSLSFAELQIRKVG